MKELPKEKLKELSDAIKNAVEAFELTGETFVDIKYVRDKDFTTGIINIKTKNEIALCLEFK